MNSEEVCLSFRDDAPKENPWSEDLLGYREFADRLAEAVTRVVAPKGYVIGLHGPWGSGKSTVLNFAEAFINKRLQEGLPDYISTVLIRFEPWIISGYQDLAAGFFKQLSESIADKVVRKIKLRARVGKAIQVGIDPAVDAAATLGAIIDHTGGLASRSVAVATKKGVKDAVANWLQEPSLQASYEKLVERLSAGDRRYVVMIDDIDRLNVDEIKSIMHMVKTVGHLPNVVYLLAYDRDIVWPALASAIGPAAKGQAYAEKIVQHEVELPTPSKHSLLKMLDFEISFLPPCVESLRWSDMVRYGILNWAKNPRNILRLSNSVRFSWSALKGELDPQDLLCMEGLRLFERDVYDWIRDHRDLILSESQGRLMTEDRRKVAGEPFRKMIVETGREDILRLLCALFPNGKPIFEEDRFSFSNENWSETVSRRGVATKAGFDSYFRLVPAADAIPKSFVDSAVAEMENEDLQTSLLKRSIELKDQMGDPLIGDYLEELMHRLQQVAPTLAFLRALVAMHDRVLAGDYPTHILSPFSSLRLLVREVLRKWDEGGTVIALREIVAGGATITAKASIIADEARQHGLLPYGGSNGRPAISINHLREIGELLNEKIEEEDEAGRLEESPVYYDFISCWACFGDKDVVRSWTSRVVSENPRYLAVLTKGLLVYSPGKAGRTYSMHEMPSTEIYDLNVLYNAATNALDSELLDEEDKKRVQALYDGLGKMPPK